MVLDTAREEDLILAATAGARKTTQPIPTASRDSDYATAVSQLPVTLEVDASGRRLAHLSGGEVG